MCGACYKHVTILINITVYIDTLHSPLSYIINNDLF